MMVDLLLFSVENFLFASSHEPGRSQMHATTMRRPDIYRCAGLLPTAVHSMLKRGKRLAFGDVTYRKSDGIPIGWREQLVRDRLR